MFDNIGASIIVDRLVPHGLRRLVEPLLPPPPRANGGPDRTIPDRACFAAVMGSSA
jgi:hypothetical protein